MTPVQFMNLANNLDSGWLKDWKARSILETLATFPDYFENRDRLRQFFVNCLKMEGFSDKGIDTITNVFFERFGKKRMIETEIHDANWRKVVECMERRRSPFQ